MPSDKHLGKPMFHMSDRNVHRMSAGFVRWFKLRSDGLGEPGYYGRFGFGPASRFGISCPFPVPVEAFMALELEPGSARELRGVVRYPAAFAAV